MYRVGLGEVTGLFGGKPMMNPLRDHVSKKFVGISEKTTSAFDRRRIFQTSPISFIVRDRKARIRRVRALYQHLPQSHKIRAILGAHAPPPGPKGPEERAPYPPCEYPAILYLEFAMLILVHRNPLSLRVSRNGDSDP